MVKNYRNFIIENYKKNSNTYLSSKMSEIEDLISSESESDDSELIYNWEDNDGEYLVINFTINGVSYRYELDLNENNPYIVSKFMDDRIDFEEEISNEEEGLEMIEKDIYSIISDKTGSILENKVFEDYIIDYIDSVCVSLRDIYIRTRAYKANETYILELRVGERFDGEIIEFTEDELEILSTTSEELESYMSDQGYPEMEEYEHTMDTNIYYYSFGKSDD